MSENLQKLIGVAVMAVLVVVGVVVSSGDDTDFTRNSGLDARNVDTQILGSLRSIQEQVAENSLKLQSLLDGESEPAYFQILEDQCSHYMEGSVKVWFCSGGDFMFADFRDAYLPYASFEGAELAFANFAGAMLTGANFTNSTSNFADFRAAILIEADFSDSVSLVSNFSEAMLDGADFTGASLHRADFSNANVSHANFRNASLNSANFAGANVSNADFWSANLNGANFTDAMIYSVYPPDIFPLGSSHARIYGEE